MFQILQKSVIIVIVCCFASCSKDEDALTYAKRTIAGKNWYLMSTTEGNQTKSFVDKSTYSIEFKVNNSTNDSDGIVGTYNIFEQSNQLQLEVLGRTQNGITANYAFQIVQITPTSLKIAYSQNSIFIQKTFMTIR
jgi:hypothetical protein